MTIAALLADKTTKTKAKTEALAGWLLDGSLPAEELVAFAETAKDADKGTCIEAIEYATQRRPDIASDGVFDFMVGALAAKAPRVKWESAKVIGNTAHLFPDKLRVAVAGLLVNASHEGTVVRWAAAFALGEILKGHTAQHDDLLASIESLAAQEQQNGVRKKYLDAVKKAAKK
ncbi:hypothetical protein [Flavobacterium sp.]|uniref:hypothetical protein n=1 Tax=Flavobacterium sp. TaxID=239 RepID=UPI0026045825|nr:hypothetical protein [Flavobacterium sp.]